MSIKDITDYVRLTPGNTNPSVIGSMVQSEVNGTLKESKAYTDEQIKLLGESGQVGRDESYDIQWDGNTEGRDISVLPSEDGYLNYYKVSNKVLKKDELVGASLTDANGTHTIAADFVQDSSEMGLEVNAFVVALSNIGLLAVASGRKGEYEVEGVHLCFPSDGTFFLSYDEAKTYFISRLTKETVHTINPKFLPKGGVGYEEKTETVIFLETTLALEAPYVGAGVTSCNSGSAVGLRAGQNYIVNWNGTEYMCECTGGVDDTYGIEGYVIAVDGLFDITDMLDASGSACLIQSYEELESVTLSISTETKTIHTIDLKFIPDFGRPYTLRLDEVGLDIATLMSGADIPIGTELANELLIAAYVHCRPIRVLNAANPSSIECMMLNFASYSSTATNGNKMVLIGLRSNHGVVVNAKVTVDISEGIAVGISVA